MATSRKCLLSEQNAVIIEEKPISLTSIDKTCLVTLLDIFDKGGNSNDSYGKNIAKIVDIVESSRNSMSVFRSFCAASFLDRYSHHAIIAGAFDEVDGKITKRVNTMYFQLRKSCQDLLNRMVTIENLNSADSDMVCLLCQLCRHNRDYGHNDQLLQIGRMAWPYTSRSLWDSDQFVSFICDIWEAIGNKLEVLCSRNFAAAWKAVCPIIIGKEIDISTYSRLRLLSVLENRRRKWSLPASVNDLYKHEYQQFLEGRKKDIFSALGCQISKRKTSLTTKRGLSAADFIRRRRSEEDVFVSDDDWKESSNDSYSERLDNVRRSLHFDRDEPHATKEQSNGQKPCDSKVLRNTENIDEERAINSNAEKSETHKTISSCPVVNAADTTMVKQESPRRSFVERKTDILKVPKKFVGRVIGCRGSVVISIQEQTGARIRAVKQNEAVANQPWTFGRSRSFKSREENASLASDSGSFNNDIKHDVIYGVVETCHKASDSSWRKTQDDSKDGVSFNNDIKLDVLNSVVEASDKESDSSWRKTHEYFNDPIRETCSVQHSGRRTFFGGHEESSSPRLKSEEDAVDKNNNIGIRDKDGSLIPWSFGRRRSSSSLEGKTSSRESPKGAVSPCVNGDKTDKNDLSGRRRSSSSSIEENRMAPDKVTVPESTSERIRGENGTIIPGSFARRWSIGSLGGNTTSGKSSRHITWDDTNNNDDDDINKNSISRSFAFGRRWSIGSLGGNAAFRERSQITVEDNDELKNKGVTVGQSGSWMCGSSEELSGVVREKNALNSCINSSLLNRRGQDNAKALGGGRRDSDGDKENIAADERKETRDNDIRPSKFVETNQESVDCDNRTELENNDEILEIFEIVGTDQEINDAKQRIQQIIQQVKIENRSRITRSFSEIAPSRSNQGGSRQFQRSLSCPVQDWDDSCQGTCESCTKGYYCRAFLVGQSQSPRAWVRPKDLSLNRTEDWVEFIVETKVNFLRRSLSESTNERPFQ